MDKLLPAGIASILLGFGIESGAVFIGGCILILLYAAFLFIDFFSNNF